MIEADHAHWVLDVQAPGAIPHYNFLRKTASDFGWDWGPAFAAAGLGSVSIEGCKGARITSMPCLTHNSFALSIFSVRSDWDLASVAAGLGSVSVEACVCTCITSVLSHAL